MESKGFAGVTVKLWPWILFVFYSAPSPLPPPQAVIINVSIVGKGTALKFKLLNLFKWLGKTGNSPYFFFSGGGEPRLSCHEGELVTLESKLWLCFCLFL